MALRSLGSTSAPRGTCCFGALLAMEQGHRIHTHWQYTYALAMVTYGIPVVYLLSSGNLIPYQEHHMLQNLAGLTCSCDAYGMSPSCSRLPSCITGVTRRGSRNQGTMQPRQRKIVSHEKSPQTLGYCNMHGDMQKPGRWLNQTHPSEP